jgi:predicted RNA-binding protein with PIN domain
MPYLIDGHNLIGAMPDIRLSDPNDEMKLVNKLRSFAARKGKKLTVIFDGGLPGGRSYASTQMVEIIFSSAHQTTADDLLMRRIPRLKDPRGWTLVTSDLKIIALAKGYHLNIVKSAAFAQTLNQIPDAPDLGEWTNPIITYGEISYWEEQMTARAATPTPDKPMMDSAAQAVERTLPKPKPKPSPTAPKPKPPRPALPEEHGDKPYMANTMDEWMKLFGVDEE